VYGETFFFNFFYNKHSEKGSIWGMCNTSFFQQCK